MSVSHLGEDFLEGADFSWMKIACAILGPRHPGPPKLRRYLFWPLKTIPIKHRKHLSFGIRLDVDESSHSMFCHQSGQIIATSHDLTPNGALVREIPLFQGNLGW